MAEPALRAGAIAVLLVCGAAQPVLAQRQESLRVAHFRVAEAAPEPRTPRLPSPARFGAPGAEERGDVRLMLVGGAAGGTLGYLTGWAVAAGVASVAEASNRDVESRLPYLRALPALASAVGTSTGARQFSCTRFSFGEIYPLNSCAQATATLLGALPGAIAQYFVPAGDVGAIAATVAAEALGAALAGRLSRRPAAREPEF